MRNCAACRLATPSWWFHRRLLECRPAFDAYAVRYWFDHPSFQPFPAANGPAMMDQACWAGPYFLSQSDRTHISWSTSSWSHFSVQPTPRIWVSQYACNVILEFWDILRIRKLGAAGRQFSCLFQLQQPPWPHILMQWNLYSEWIRPPASCIYSQNLWSNYWASFRHRFVSRPFLPSSTHISMWFLRFSYSIILDSIWIASSFFSLILAHFPGFRACRWGS